MKRHVLWVGVLSASLGCGGEDAQPVIHIEADDAGNLQPDATVPGPEAGEDSAEVVDASDSATAPNSCGFEYGFKSAPLPMPAPRPAWQPAPGLGELPVAAIAHAEPAPPGTMLMPRPGMKPGPEDIVMPTYNDNMPLFERGRPWAEPTRCYETPAGVKVLDEAEAYELYKTAAEATTGVTVRTDDEVRSVVGIRGAYPGTFAWHGNTPDLFNDTLVLLWKSGGVPHVREFPAHTDVGAHNFGANSSSSLRPNRRYHYINNWHNTYNALRIHETAYKVRDDTNHNGHWDSDRNGWLSPLTVQDYDRNGSAHNIHMGSVDGPLHEAHVDNWSAGCQVIPGMANWTEFITHAWTKLNDPVDYFLLDARDIAPEVWAPCTPDGTHGCPYKVATFPFTDSRDTSSVSTSQFAVYNCSTADESGPEVVYVVTVDEKGTLTATVDCGGGVDVDVHLLEGDDKNACLARNDATLTYELTPGRYFIVVDTYVKGGQALAGAYTLHFSFN
jgi:hypothetical protein